MNEKVNQKYTAVGGLLDDALNSAKSIELAGEEENAELTAIRATLENMNESFKAEIDKLESSSEWDKFCIAYFGETNAGKSTIIESLRIIYNEETRWLEKDKQNKEYMTMLSKHSEEYGNLLKLLSDVNDDLQNPVKIQKANSKTSVVRDIVEKIKGSGIWLFILGVIIGNIIGIVFF